MAAPRRVVELAFLDNEAAELARLARSRTDPASRVERARMLLAYRQTPSFYAVGRDIGVTHQTVERCVRRAERLGVLAALDDSPRPGRGPVITDEARTFVVDLAYRKAKDLGYPHELWTTRLLAKHVREHGPAAGRECLATLAQGHVVQDPRGARGQAAQGALFSRASRSRIRRQDGRGLVRLSRGPAVEAVGPRARGRDPGGRDRVLRREARRAGDRNDGAGLAACPFAPCLPGARSRIRPAWHAEPVGRH